MNAHMLYSKRQIVTSLRRITMILTKISHFPEPLSFVYGWTLLVILFTLLFGISRLSSDCLAPILLKTVAPEMHSKFQDCTVFVVNPPFERFASTDTPLVKIIAVSSVVPIKCYDNNLLKLYMIKQQTYTT